MSGHVVPIKVYVTIFAALLLLTATTVIVSGIDLGRLNTVVALTIAVTKALLVLLYFMHVRYGTRLTWLVVSGGFVWLGILILFTMSDVLTRSWVMLTQ
jgi:cytochrome c oxidase subunit 4